MTWEETIQYIRTQPKYEKLVELAYFEEELSLNVERFKESTEFKETLVFLKKYAPIAKKILDIGSGNGISAVAFALEGYEVTSVEPDSSTTIGAGAIRLLKEHYKLDNLLVYEAFAEDIAFETNSFDVVYARQCMHHAYNLEKFVQESARVLKLNGLFFTVRDHVIFDEADKQKFLETHPLQKYYGGENAFTPQEYKTAIQKAGLDLKEELKFYDNVINFFPLTNSEIEKIKNKGKQERVVFLQKRIGFFSKLPILQTLYNLYLDKKVGKILDEKNVAGRSYSYLALKK